MLRENSKIHREITTNLIYDDHQLDFSDNDQVSSSEFIPETTHVYN